MTRASAYVKVRVMVRVKTRSRVWFWFIERVRVMASIPGRFMFRAGVRVSVRFSATSRVRFRLALVLGRIWTRARVRGCLLLCG